MTIKITMSYAHILNLYKSQDILLFKECYAMEKIEGTSAHISFKEDGTVTFFSGGANHEMFVKLFDQEKLKAVYDERYNVFDLTIYGEAYGGKIQGMSKTYGPDLKFVAFEVKIGHSWLDVPNAKDVVSHFNLDFVDYVRIPTTLEAIDAERDKDSVQAVKNKMGEGHMREGIILRPIVEVRLNNGSRIMAKHKRPEFSETRTKRKVVDPAKLEVLKGAERIAEEWVTPRRLEHVLDKIPDHMDISKTGIVIKAMQEDVLREAEGEIEVNKSVLTAIGKKTATLFKNLVTNIPQGEGK